MAIDVKTAEWWLTSSQTASIWSAVLFLVAAGLQLNADWLPWRRADWLNRRSRWVAIVAALMAVCSNVTGIYFGRISARAQAEAAQKEQTILNANLESAKAAAEMAAGRTLELQIKSAEQAKEIGAVSRLTLPRALSIPANVCTLFVPYRGDLVNVHAFLYAPDAATLAKSLGDTLEHCHVNVKRTAMDTANWWALADTDPRYVPGIHIRFDGSRNSKGLADSLQALFWKSGLAADVTSGDQGYVEGAPFDHPPFDASVTISTALKAQ